MTGIPDDAPDYFKFPTELARDVVRLPYSQGAKLAYAALCDFYAGEIPGATPKRAMDVMSGWHSRIRKARAAADRASGHRNASGTDSVPMQNRNETESIPIQNRSTDKPSSSVNDGSYCAVARHEPLSHISESQQLSCPDASGTGAVSGDDPDYYPEDLTWGAVDEFGLPSLDDATSYAIEHVTRDELAAAALANAFLDEVRRVGVAGLPGSGHGWMAKLQAFAHGAGAHLIGGTNGR